MEDHHHRQTRIPSNKCRQCTNKVKIKSFKNTKTFPSFQTKWFISFFFTIGIYCLTRSLNFALLGWGWGKDTQKDIITYRLNRPKGCVKQAIDNNHSDQRTTAELLQDQSRTNGDMINTGVKRGMALIRRPTMIASPSTGKEGTNGIVLFHDSPIGNAVAVCNAPKRPKQQARKLCSVNNDKRVRREP